VSAPPLLIVEELRTYFFSKRKRAFIRSVDGVGFTLQAGETLGIVGESGSGKSVTALTLMGLVPSRPGVISGKIGFRSPRVQKNLLQDLGDRVRLRTREGRIEGVEKDCRGWERNVERLMENIRGKEISMIFQNPKAALNPFSSIGSQIAESIRLHTAVDDPKAARERAIHWLERVRMDSPRLRYFNNPYGLSGGMCQRAMIALALAAEPALLIADEPTTGLDATIQSKILELLAELKTATGVTILLISHDIHVVRELCDRVAVMYGGRILESGPAGAVLSPDAAHRHPYTEALLASIPTDAQIREKRPLRAIGGEVLDSAGMASGCRFYGRCNRVEGGIREACESREPELTEVGPGHSIRCWRCP